MEVETDWQAKVERLDKWSFLPSLFRSHQAENETVFVCIPGWGREMVVILKKAPGSVVTEQRTSFLLWIWNSS